ncbi:unnamed protein product [Sphagnum balticum]
MALYFNAYYAPFWAVSKACTLYLKVGRRVSAHAHVFQYDSLRITYQVTMVALHIASFCVEGVRLYLGIVGNLMEKVGLCGTPLVVHAALQIPELSGFTIVTMILQLPAVCYMTFNTAAFILPMDTAVDSVQLAFIFVQVMGACARAHVQVATCRSWRV